MSKFVILSVVVAIAVCILAKPPPEPKFPELVAVIPDYENFFGMPDFPSLPVLPIDPMPVLAPEAILDLKGGPNQNVSGSYHSSSSSFKSVDGKVVDDSHHDRDITNVNGHVEEHSD